MKCLAVLLCMMAIASAVSYDRIKEEWEANKMGENQDQSASNHQLIESSLQQNNYEDKLLHEFVNIINGINNTLKKHENLGSQEKVPSRRFLFWLMKIKHEIIKDIIDTKRYILFGKTTPKPGHTTRRPNIIKEIIDRKKEFIDRKKEFIDRKKEFIDRKKEIFRRSTRRPPRVRLAKYNNHPGNGYRPPPYYNPNKEYNQPYYADDELNHAYNELYYDDEAYNAYNELLSLSSKHKDFNEYQDSAETNMKRGDKETYLANMYNDVEKPKIKKLWQKPSFDKNKDSSNQKQKLLGEDTKVKQNENIYKKQVLPDGNCVFLQGVCFPDKKKADTNIV